TVAPAPGDPHRGDAGRALRSTRPGVLHALDPGTVPVTACLLGRALPARRRGALILTQLPGHAGEGTVPGWSETPVRAERADVRVTGSLGRRRRGAVRVRTFAGHAR